MIVKWKTVFCSLVGATFVMVTEPGASVFVTVTVTVWPAPTMNAPEGSIVGGLNVAPGSSSVTVQLEPAGTLFCVTLPEPVTCTW